MTVLLIDSAKMYKLMKSDTSHILSVVCGGIAMYEVKIVLSEDEVGRYQAEGERYVDELAYDVSKNESKYKDRILAQ